MKWVITETAGSITSPVPAISLPYNTPGTDYPQLICPLMVKELRNKDEREVYGVLNPTILDLTTLGHILTFQGQVKRKMLLFGNINSSENNV